MTTTRRACFHKGNDCQGTCVKALIWPTDQVQISCTNLKIAAIPCCRNCNSWLKNCCIWWPLVAHHRSTSLNHQPLSESTHEQARRPPQIARQRKRIEMRFAHLKTHYGLRAVTVQWP